MIMMVREQEILAQGREEGRVEERKKLTDAFFKRLLATGMSEEQARALVFVDDEGEFIPTPAEPDTHGTKKDGMNT